MAHVGRRRFLRNGIELVMLQQAARLLPASPLAMDAGRIGSAIPVVDTHIHLFDPTRIGGVPWPYPDDTALYKPALPARYRKLSEPFGVVGAIAIECSPLPADNDWLLGVAASDDYIVGVIGDLDPALPNFPAELERLQANPLFRGIRYGNLWGRNLGAQLNDAQFVENLKVFARSGLLLESANPNPTLIADLLRLTTLVPTLRVVIDHLPQAVPPADVDVRTRYLNDLRALSRRADLYVKGSEILRRVDEKISMRVADYRPWLDQIWEIFGEDRMLFGSDWPNSDHLASFSDTVMIAQQYMVSRTKSANERYFWKNSVDAYGWHARSGSQVGLSKSFPGVKR